MSSGGVLNTRILSICAVVFLSVLVFAASSGAARETVRFKGYSAGTIVIKTNERRLYYVTADGEPIRNPFGVAKPGKAWPGKAPIDAKLINPAGKPPEPIQRDSLKLPQVVPGAARENPL